MSLLHNAVLLLFLLNGHCQSDENGIGTLCSLCLSALCVFTERSIFNFKQMIHPKRASTQSLISPPTVPEFVDRGTRWLRMTGQCISMHSISCSKKEWSNSSLNLTGNGTLDIPTNISSSRGIDSLSSWYNPYSLYIYPNVPLPNHSIGYPLLN